ncbi:hypothetical protein J2W21_000051 [Sinomonas atrocyanea]|uniref:hypothetical protein n=1 Tax=Sinomonas atrocyanea TaxID=37927 RepID=UPI0027847EB8|nr:hypothetical protein [Sinomonas atrocyanea]MDP9882572.1 hypothetical protein [Sinomonas atrocyanea]
MTLKRGRGPRPPVCASLGALAMTAALLTGCTTAAGLQAVPGARNGTAVTASPVAPAFYNLVTDLFFVTLPPGSTRTGQKCPRPTSASHGGDCTIEFTSALPPQDVYADFARRAAQTGWAPERKNSDGRVVAWAKTFADGSSAHLLLRPLDPGQTSPPYSYSVTGSI